MAVDGRSKLKLLCYLLLIATLLIGVDALAARPFSPSPSNLPEKQRRQGQGLLPRSSPEAAPAWDIGGGRRMLVGSRAPTCTYNECRGCRRRCSAQEVPVDASDPMNSAYHYRCMCDIH